MSKILVCEDDEGLRTQLKILLEDNGHHVITAENGIAGLAQLDEATDLDLLITDLEMPDLDGLELLSKLRVHPTYAALPSIMLTACNDPALKKQGRELKVGAWIIKPHNEKGVLLTVDKLVQT